MQKRIPSAGTPLHPRDLRSAFHGLWQPRTRLFQEALRSRLGIPYVSLVNSGTTACYVALKALSRLSPRREVVLPAYTAPSLILPIKKAGLVPRLCDVSCATFNLDPDALEQAVGPQTLCVMPVHMFGLPCDMEAIRRGMSNRPGYILEDAASSFGSRLHGQETGTLGDIGFFSFNRGKNLSTLAGGSLMTDNPDLFALIEQERRPLPSVDPIAQVGSLLKLTGLTVAVRPVGYTLLYPLIRRFKYTTLHTDFRTHQYPEVLAGAGVTLLERADDLCRRRHQHGRFLLESLHQVEGIRLPMLPADAWPAFNQFPLLIEDPDRRTRLADDIRRRTGVETTTLYPDPLHRIYDLGYTGREDPFPNATCMARHLLLIPTHPLMERDRLTRVVEIVRTQR
jgi:dTDP-4-amino-4,6-dideoxygalactose transaminase